MWCVIISEEWNDNQDYFMASLFLFTLLFILFLNVLTFFIASDVCLTRCKWESKCVNNFLCQISTIYKYLVCIRFYISVHILCSKMALVWDRCFWDSWRKTILMINIMLYTQKLLNSNPLVLFKKWLYLS